MISKVKNTLKSYVVESDIQTAKAIHALKFAVYRLFRVNDDVAMRPIKQYDVKGTTAIDVGANSGNWSHVMSKLVGESGNVIAFEPDPYYFDVTHHALKILSCDNVELKPFGLSDRNTVRYLKVKDKDGRRYAGLSHLSNKTDGGIEVTLKKLDDVIDQRDSISRVSILKVDVEGHELQVLSGAKQTIREHRPIVISEIAHLERYGESFEELKRFMGNLNYRPIDITRYVDDHQAYTFSNDRIFVPHEQDN